MGKKNKLSQSDIEKEKSRVVYDRLKREYFPKKDQTDKNLAAVFGITKQAMSQRKKSGKWDAQEIMDLFPDINEDWVFAENLSDLRRIPVRTGKNGHQGFQSNSESAPNKDELSRKQVKELLGQIEGFVRTLKDNL